jgi:uncharacterized protein DUF6789
MAIARTYGELRAGRSVAGGVVAGVVGGAVLAALLAFLAFLRHQDLWRVLKGAGAPFLGARATRPGFDAEAVLVGVLGHFAVSIIWGVLFAVIFYGLSKGATMVAGLFWGVVVWLGMYYLVLPLVGLARITHDTPIAHAIVTHVVFGLAVAAGFLPFQMPRRPYPTSISVP